MHILFSFFQYFGLGKNTAKRPGITKKDGVSFLYKLKLEKDKEGRTRKLSLHRTTREPNQTPNPSKKIHQIKTTTDQPPFLEWEGQR